MLILDFYVDEPACFGVPPYLSPYARYSAGALAAAGVPEKDIDYLTVDDWRAQNKELNTDPELVVLTAGSTVPGKYLGGKIGTVAEVLEFLEFRRKFQPGGVNLIGGPIRYASAEIRDRIAELGGILVRGDIELYASRFAAHPGGPRAALEALGQTHTGERRTYEQVDLWAQAGAFLSNLHPNFPYLILELETYRGCTRDVFCSFCTEAFYGKPVFRALEGIKNETAELHRQGNRYFRLGRQADLMTYLPDMADFKNSFPRPRPESIARLYATLRQAAPDLRLLHLDNINPGLIATFPEESREIIKIICEHNTPGDTAAMGLESADPVVIKTNDLKCDVDEARRAIEIVNEYGSARVNGVPKLLPGINILAGLPGESDDTFRMNFDFLKGILDSGLLLRRINIRQTVTYDNTKLERLQTDGTPGETAGDTSRAPRRKGRKKGNIRERFLYYRERIRKEIDRPMLALNFPPGTLVDEVILEARNQGFFLGRPLGSYPVTIKIPLTDELAATAFEQKKPLRVFVTGAEERSLLGLAHPVGIGRLDVGALGRINGIGKRSAGRIVLERPHDFDELQRICEGRAPGQASDYAFSVR